MIKKVNKFVFKNFKKKTWTTDKFFKQSKIFNFQKKKKPSFELFNFFQKNFKLKFKSSDIKDWQDQLFYRTNIKPTSLKKIFICKKTKKVGVYTSSLINSYMLDSSKKFKKTFYKRNEFCYNAYEKKYGYGRANSVWFPQKLGITENILKTFVNAGIEKEYAFKKWKDSSEYQLPVACKDMNLKKKYFNKIFRIKSKNRYINKKNYYDKNPPPIYQMFFASTNSKRRIPVHFPKPLEMARTLKQEMYTMDNRSFRFRKKNYRCNKKTGMWGGSSMFYWMFYKTDLTEKESNKRKYSRYDRWWKNKWFNKKDSAKRRERAKLKIKERKKKKPLLFFDDEDLDSIKNQITRVKKIHVPMKIIPPVNREWDSKYYKSLLNRLKWKSKRRKITHRSWIQFTRVHIYVYKDALLNLAKGIISYTKTIQAYTQSRPIVKTKIKKKKFTAVLSRQMRRVIFNQLVFKKFNFYQK